jgi:hypothetical protein
LAYESRANDDEASDEVRWTTIGKVDEASARKEGRVCHGS